MGILSENQILSIPRRVRAKVRGWKCIFILFSDSGEEKYLVDPFKASVDLINDPKEVEDIKSEIYIPKRIFLDAVSLNMFHHSSISKRNKYLFESEIDLNKYMIFLRMLEKVELEVFPLNVRYFWNLTFAYFRRWREILVYFKAFLLLKKGLPMYDVEEELLKDS